MPIHSHETVYSFTLVRVSVDDQLTVQLSGPPRGIDFKTMERDRRRLGRVELTAAGNRVGESST